MNVPNSEKKGGKLYTDEEKKKFLEEAIRNGGFYTNDGCWNSIMKFDNDDHIYRGRVETLIIKDGDSIFLRWLPKDNKNETRTYLIPGGSLSKDVSNADQAINECREEARINVTNIRSSGITYKEYKDPPKWSKNRLPVNWNGNYTEVYIADFDSYYDGFINKTDIDSFMVKGKFFPIKSVYSQLRKEHKDALNAVYKNQYVTEQKSILDSDHETKTTDKSFKYIDIKSASANKYLNTDKYYKKFSKYISNDCIGEIVVCVEDDKLAGYVIVDNKKYPGFIVPLEVMKPYRGLGLSKKLLNDAIHKYGAIDLCVDKNNEVAINLYKKFGFVIIGNGDKKSRYYMKLKSKLTKDEKEKIVMESAKSGYNQIKIAHANLNKYSKDHGSKFLSHFRGNENSEESVKTEAALTAAQRREIPDNQFGIPSQRRYPLNDRNHVIAAIRMFNRVDRKHEKELAYNIIKAMKRYNINTDIIGDANRLKSYIR